MKPKDIQHDEDCSRLATSLTGFALGLASEDILVPGRGTPAISFARQVAMYLSHVALGMSLARVARAFDRDRSTVAHACHIVEDRRDDPDFDMWIEQLEDGLRSVIPLHAKNAA
ncbi:MAG: helix-turn-helix domain-containing protein [Pseudomonadota bacterium]